MKKKTKFTPYKPCIGNKYRVCPKLYRPFAILIGSNFCNEFFNFDINKIKFISQFIRFFYKSRWGHNISFNNPKIQNCSILSLTFRIQKSIFKKLLLKLNYQIPDYNILKKRQYVCNIDFFFNNLDVVDNANISLDIKSKIEDSFNFFIVLQGFYIEFFYNIIYFYNFFIKKPFINLNSQQFKEISIIDFNSYYNKFEILKIESFIEPKIIKIK